MHYQPRGVIGMITPWNFPLILTIGEAVPALAAGNSRRDQTVGMDPADRDAQRRPSARSVHDRRRAAGYSASRQRLRRDGGALVDEADMIAFTGSARTGKMVAERAAKRLVPVSLELGGKDPMIVLRDADIERAANAAVWGAFTNSGQVCISVERVYVEDAVADEFTRRVVERPARCVRARTRAISRRA